MKNARSCVSAVLRFSGDPGVVHPPEAGHLPSCLRTPIHPEAIADVTGVAQTMPEPCGDEIYSADGAARIDHTPMPSVTTMWLSVPTRTGWPPVNSPNDGNTVMCAVV
jgi:hypothetical protein